MPATDRRYVVIGLYWASRPDTCQLMAVDGKVVVFDTAEMARQTLPRFGSGRLPSWSVDRETICWSPIDPRGYNRAVILTGYDPYDVPGGMRSIGVYSEAEGRDWRHHVYYRHVIEALIARADGLEADRLQRVAEQAGGPVLLAAA